MHRKTQFNLRILSAIVLLTILITTGAVGEFSSAFAQEPTPGEPEVLAVEEVNPYFTVERLRMADGTELEKAIIGGPPEPPEGFEADSTLPIEGQPSGIPHASFPSYDWVFGCSAVSGAMIAGYYDRNGYPYLYEGPTDGGVMPLTDTSWVTWSDGSATYPNNPLVASHNGVDGRTTKGSIDDYWIEYGSNEQDPYITGPWTQHTWGTAIGDYMKTSQSAHGNMDGSTTFVYYTSSGDKLTCEQLETFGYGDVSGTIGRKEFYEERGYSVTECYNQRTYNASASGGFTLADLQAEIDAGHPVMINVTGHTMVAYGYSGTTVYIRDTWDSNPANIKEMIWDATPTYGTMELYGVSIVKLGSAGPSAPTPVEPAGSYWIRDLTYKWTKVDGATHYQYRVWDGGTKVWDKTVYPGACDATHCTHTPTVQLIDSSYKWQVRVKVEGVWSPWSALKWYTIKAGFDSQFTSEAAGWVPTYGAWTWSVKNGNYRTTGLSNDTWSTSMFDQKYGIYTYEAKLRRQGTEMGSSYGILLNGNPWPLGNYKGWNKGYAFYITRNGNYSIWKYTGGTATSIVGWTLSAVIKNSWYNTLKVTYNKNSGYTQFFINGTRVHSGYLNDYKWGNVGVTMFRVGTGWEKMLVDYAKLSITAPSSPTDSKATEGLFFDENNPTPGEGGGDWGNP